MDISDLNIEQRRAVKHDTGPMLVVAGAGTGKTNVITRRIAYLIETEKAKPEEILALTFTDKAAGEMLDRLDGLIGWQAYRVPVMTFHAFGANILSRFAHHAGWPTRMEVLSDTAALVLLRRHFLDLDLHYYSSANNELDFLSSMLSYISLLQNADIGVEQFENYVHQAQLATGIHRLDLLELQDKAKFYRLYDDIKRRYGMIDFNDQMQLPLQLLQQKANILQRLQQEYKYFLVDEYQDTNAAQDNLLRLLVPRKGNIFAVGDDDQAIYGFRGAKISNILGFSQHYGAEKVLVLTRNYRSSQEILNSAYKLIGHNNPNRLEAMLGLDKKLQAGFSGDAVKFLGAADAADEQSLVLAKIKLEMSQGVVPDQIAVLATSHAALRSMAKLMRHHHLSYQLSSSLNIFEQQEIVQLWYLLGWLSMMGDEAAITQLLLGPYINWPSELVRRVTDTCTSQLISLESAIAELATMELTEAVDLMSTLSLWRTWARDLPVSQLVYQLIFETGVSDMWVAKAETSDRILRVFEDLQLWLKHMQQFESVALDTTLAGYLTMFPKPPEIESEIVSGEAAGVQLLTIHASKGLEFESVYIINNSFEAWTERSGNSSTDLPTALIPVSDELPPEHEKRRLLYVAMTRAAKRLVMTAPTLQKGGRTRRLSPFIHEIFDEQEIIPVERTSSSTKIEKTLQELQRYAPLLDGNKLRPLPFERDGWLELSTTQLQAYEYCPYEFYVAQVLKISLPIGPQLGFGTLLHKIFEIYYELKAEGNAELTILLQRLEAGWTSRGYRTPKESEIALQTARQSVSYFFEREEQAARLVQDIEKPFIIRFAEAKLAVRGRIDAIFVTADGIEIRDYKTGRARDIEKLSRDAKTNIQLRTYALAIHEEIGASQIDVVLDYVVTGSEGRAELSPTILRNHREKLASLAEKIRNREFAPKKDSFHNCIVGKYWGSSEENYDEA